jgi:hypothetical protein
VCSGVNTEKDCVKSCFSEPYTFEEVAFESCVEKIAATPALVTDGFGEDLPRRCGRFFGREHLFLDRGNASPSKRGSKRQTRAEAFTRGPCILVLLHVAGDTEQQWA